MTFLRSLAEPFKCGATITNKVRTVFRHSRPSKANATQANATHANATQANQMNPNSTLAEPISVVGTLNLTDASGNSSEDIPEYEDFEMRINSEMAGMTRIVNGEDCPQGECPWQVKLVT